MMQFWWAFLFFFFGGGVGSRSGLKFDSLPYQLADVAEGSIIINYRELQLAGSCILSSFWPLFSRNLLYKHQKAFCFRELDLTRAPGSHWELHLQTPFLSAHFKSWLRRCTWHNKLWSWRHDMTPPPPPLGAPALRARAAEQTQRTSSFPRPIRSHSHRCTCLTR